MKRWYWLAVLALPLVISGCTSNSRYQLAVDENTSLSSEIDGLNAEIADLQTEIDELQASYDQMAKVFPPRDFASIAELTTWLSKDKTNELPAAPTIEAAYSRGLALQLAALKDGFIISIDQEFISDAFFFILCIAVIDGDLWVWDIDTDEPYEPIGWGKVTRNP